MTNSVSMASEHGGHHRPANMLRRWYEAHGVRFDEAPTKPHALSRQDDFTNSADEALGILERLRTHRSTEQFVEELREWSVKKSTLDFNGFNGQMFVNQLVNRSDDQAALADVLADVLTVPSDDDEIARKITRLVDYIEPIRVGAHPAPSRAPFLLSYFWALADHESFPTMWPSGANFVQYLTGESLPDDQAERYMRFREIVRSLDDDNVRFECVASYWEEQHPVFLDPVLCERSEYGLELAENDPNSEDATANASALVAAGRYIGTQLNEVVSSSLGRSTTAKAPSRKWRDGEPRADTWADWVVDNAGLGIRVWVSSTGVSIAVRPGWFRNGWYEEAERVIQEHPVPGFRQLAGRHSTRGVDVGHQGLPHGEFVYGKFFPVEEVADLDLVAEVTDVAVASQGLIDRLAQLGTGEEPVADDDWLVPLVERFRANGYPRNDDKQHHADREEFAKQLAKDALPLAEPTELRRIWNTGRYGGPGPQSVLNTTIRAADAAEYDRIVDTISYLCWGEGDDEDRIDAVLDQDGDLWVKGLGESVVMKMLAICHPSRYVPVFPYRGPKGKLKMLQLLRLPEPEGETRGQLQVRSNDLLRKRLDPFFPGDPWGMGQFLYRYAEQEESDNGPVDDEVDPLDELAEELLVERKFLDEIVQLLRDKGQVIFYGPPGTGKTYLARKLAQALVPDITRRSLVQFHPSTSYEDFFEGYRPETTVEGEMTYRLTPGPLALLAERAAAAPGKRHLMIIDEINRANLPRVLGELLFLLEYRDEQVPTLYRPDDPFKLPADLWFIGTMNTADRSIALVDAALRRRFHFVPFFPDSGPMSGLLDRWLKREGEPLWVGELVAQVNDELSDRLGGSHLQLGASHFMRADLDEERLRQIWKYNIEPFIEDQFFGDPDQIAEFEFDAVLRRYLKGLEVESVDQLVETDDGVVGALPESVDDEPDDGQDSLPDDN